jgi:uncharacterized protein
VEPDDAPKTDEDRPARAPDHVADDDDGDVATGAAVGAAAAPSGRAAAVGPTERGERIRSLDLLRGVAVLGILLVNIWAYALPFPAAMNPHLSGFDQGLDRLAYVIVNVAGWTKFMPIFSMLFGAGIVLFAQRLEERGRKPAGFFYRRQFWLLVIGLIHGYLLWNGDILVPYAVCGMILYLFRRKRPRTLVVLAIAAMLVSKVTMQGGALYMESLREQAQAAESALAAGETLTAEQEAALEQWRDQQKSWSPTAEEIRENVAAMRGGWPTIFAESGHELVMMHLFVYPFGFGWNIAGFMLLGMALFKTGILKGKRPPRFYIRMAVLCYGVGLPLALLGLWYFNTRQGAFVDVMRLGFPIVEVSGPIVALGHIALIILAGQRGWWGGLEARLAAAGRMAFTNYLTQTIIGTTIFYGWGFGLYGALSRFELLGVMVAIWALQLWWSPLWLRHFRFGPFEWAWRSLTYRRRQPLRRVGIVFRPAAG